MQLPDEIAGYKVVPAYQGDVSWDWHIGERWQVGVDDVYLRDQKISVFVVYIRRLASTWDPGIEFPDELGVFSYLLKFFTEQRTKDTQVWET